MRLQSPFARAVILLMALSLAVPAISLLEPAEEAAAYSGISMDLVRPTYAAKSARVECTLTVYGGPAADMGGNYSYRATIEGENTTGGLVEPSSAASPTGVFKFNLTMPAFAPQTIDLVINVTSKGLTLASVSTETFYEIKVVDPILIKAEVFNVGEVDAKNVTVKIYADGALLQTRIINVSAQSSKTIMYNWTFLDIRDGKHVITVTVNDPDQLVEFSDGNNEFSQVIYVGEQSNVLGGILTMIVIVLSVFVALMWFSKPQRRSKKT
ncbi:MAG: hypothetical protein MUC90_01625 [Thermoplasmata archaeon]|nr:hypothetical protein [Thermoplasmata archaeon]